jgi:hypothetical protein
MNIGTALGLAQNSMRDFEKAMKDMKLRELYDLVDNLRFVESNSAFSAAKNALKRKLSAWYDQVKKWENRAKNGYSYIYFQAYNLTGFEVFNAQGSEFDHNVIPSEFFKSLINEVSSW